jgi:alkyl sulfatase BDS1-like metallo-beta-lactamase superfamily hydrolase
VAILAPQGFIDRVCSENVFAGAAMTRRSQYSYGIVLPRGKDGQIDAGLGKATSVGPITLIPPTDTVTTTGETRTIDGVEFVFEMAPDSEAPSEMMFHLPGFRVLDAAELACSTMHNIYTLRGAQVRDASAWSSYLDEAIERFGDATDIVIGQHNWPTFGHDAVIDYLKHQRDLYKYIHDQTLHLANQGYTMNEIAERLEHEVPLPESLAHQWYLRGYYGSVSHDAKAVYQKYLGWYDSNPANLEPLPPEEAGARYVDFMGGADSVLEKAQAAFHAGDYRWVATVTNHVVFADPSNTAARSLCADALEQLGYQAECSTWRNHYLMGAYELRNGRVGILGTTANADTLTAMSVGLIFDYLGIRLNAQRADGRRIVLDWVLTDPDEQYTLNLENSALTYRQGVLAAEPDATVTLSRATLDSIMTATDQKAAVDAALAAGAMTIEGAATKLTDLVGMLDAFGAESFNIVEP